MNPLRIAVLGTGHLGSIHTKLWNSVQGVALTGIFDPDHDKARALAEQYSTTAFSSVEDALEHADAVTIAAPTSTHHALARQCLEADKHCFIEKPITSTYAEACNLIDLAAGRNLVIQVGHVERFNPGLGALHGYNLAPTFIEAHRLAQFKPRATDVSVIHDLMIHDIDIVLWLVKSPVVQIDANGVAVLTDTPDIANARIRFENGCVANLTASRISQRQMRKMRLFQRDAYISIDFAAPSVEVFRLVPEGETSSSGVPALMLGNIDAGTQKRTILFEKPEIEHANAIQLEQQSFVRAIRENSPAAVSATEAAEALRVAEIIANMVGVSVQK
jgi:predicted dehydrogenase